MRPFRDLYLKFRLSWLLSVCVLLETIAIQPLAAQITPDNTLPNSSAVDERGDTTVITGGTRTGSNLFHSFRDFSVARGRTASFQQIDPAIANVISRVTGGSASNINGAIEVLQVNGNVSSANVFLINPNGVLFGADASLNVGGSFLATTGDRLVFADGFEFRTDDTQTRLLTVSVPAGIQFGRTPGLIRNASISDLEQDEFGRAIAGGLQVNAGKTLALVGGAIKLPGGVMIAPAGRIELGSVGGQSTVGLQADPSGWRLTYAEAQDLQDITFTDTVLMDVSGIQGGSIQLRGGQITLTDNSLISAYTLGDRDGGRIQVQADRLELDQRSFINTLTLGTGNSPAVVIRAHQVEVRGGSQISTRTAGAGVAGELTLVARDAVELDGEGSTLDFLTGLFAQADAAAPSSSSSGRISVSTRALYLRNGAQVSTSTLGAADAGDLEIRSETVELSGSLATENGEVITSSTGRIFPSGLFADTDANASGNGGLLSVYTNRLQLRDGAYIQTNTEGSGRAGDLSIRASDRVEVIGTAGEGLPPTSIQAASGGVPRILGGGEPSATGRGGTVSITTRNLQVAEGASIAVTSLNPNGAEGAGDIRIQAQVLSLDDRGRLLTEAASGNGGNMELRLENFLVLRRNSQISATAGVEQRGGNGGNIYIESDFITAASSENSDIRADAFTGRGGNITIRTSGILGIQPRFQDTAFSDITASSQFGTNGTVQINSPETDPEQGLVELPSYVLDAANQVAQTCPVGGTTIARAAQTNQFVVTGRGGLPPTPSEVRSSEAVLTGWATATPAEDIRPAAIDSSTSNPSPAPSAPPPAISSAGIEAQNWIINPSGQVQLVAASPSPIAFSSALCRRGAF
ncbi:S-layer family protein [Phormidium tenue FACHB-886]|nr:S-layer family protein [Phormidium tenue FACHB-886]